MDYFLSLGAGGFAVPVGNPAPPPPPSRVDRGPKTPPSGSEREPRRKGGVSQPSLGPPTFEPPPNRRPSPAPPVSESLRLSDERRYFFLSLSFIV